MIDEIIKFKYQMKLKISIKKLLLYFFFFIIKKLTISNHFLHSFKIYLH